MIEFSQSDIFETDCSALTNTVNTVGAMGAGIAKGVKERWFPVYMAYRRDCGVGLDCAGVRDPRFGAGHDQDAPPCCGPHSTCAVHRVRPGGVIVRDVPRMADAAPDRRAFRSPVRRILEVATKRHWRDPSRMADVALAVDALAVAIADNAVASVAVAPLGCGNGGLHWPDVRALLVARLGGLDARIVIHGVEA